ncbi:LuxR C-terminal-related transcriptional regulator [Corynebacterium pygosceleis]|uniref:LuxR C-terminal-related transcriptional regulator n=1 Tax=Corynebacterium pygosceleis TaxID=2800406 RepID=A0ABT3WQP0_9CORY|nr:LuxR C-terminal-related transcriptional regulator [Corynebacterium pygosceleis]MCK7675611.1 LuxR C-terminal-related transcriptional regulator [Corynebacterium pygosceleis]MCL0120995.1 LuxR C-terminal-related transcriptional regulator [Corynebacterium pygosceleis]MCX7444565.1 LuxR C-terminal-related transcriptional regulator [Corynebacterium pygosceleis]
MTQMLGDTRETASPVPRLTGREIEVARVWFTSRSKAVAADILTIREDTVRSHITNVRNKYHALGRDARTKPAMRARMSEDGFLDVTA